MFDTMDTGPVADPIVKMRSGISALAGENRSYWTGDTRSERLIELLETRERLDAEILRLVGEWHRDRAWETDGSLSPRSWLTRNTPLAESQAHRLVKNARIVDQHDSVAAGLASGRITTQHVEAIGRVMSNDRFPLLEEHAPVLIEQAAKLPVDDFTVVMRQWASLADDELAKEDFMTKWDRRHLHIATGLDGWAHIEGFLDPRAGQALTTVLDHISPPDPEDSPDGPRALPQRRADGICDLANWYLNGAKPAGNPPNINTVIDVATMVGQTPELAVARCELEGIGPVTRTVLDQTCCDARFTRFIMAGTSQILDMGRTQRFPTKAQRRAVILRDRHCRFRNCGRKPQWCDIHHIDGWVESLGETNINNLILLCRRHHTLIHNSQWTIKQTASGNYEFIHPARGP